MYRRFLIRFISALVLMLVATPQKSSAFRYVKLAQSQDTILFKRDSLGAVVRDSLGNPIVDSIATKVLRDELDTLYQSFWKMDTITLPLMDTLLKYHNDSLYRRLPDAYDIREAKKRIKREYRDSVVKNTPRILQTFMVPDSLSYKRILAWNLNTHTSEITFTKMDTTYNDNYFDAPFQKGDVGATYLGVSGSAAQQDNYFKRANHYEAPFYNPYMRYTYTPETLPMYNTKTPYVILAYWGNPFSNREREESNINVLCTQNITPALNLTLAYNNYGAAGLYQGENTSNRTAVVALNYLGKRYSAHGGFITNGVKRQENGGISDVKWVTDTVVDTKIVPVTLRSANNEYRKRTFFLNHQVAVPINFFRKNRDSLSIGEGTVTYFGHNFEYTNNHKLYTDNISSDVERQFYFNQFNYNEKSSHDSLGVNKLENRIYMNLQPFATDAILSKINVGIGHQLLMINEVNFVDSLTNNRLNHNNFYIYGGLKGMFKRYVQWDATVRYNFLGYNINDMYVGGNIKLSLYPIDGGIHIGAHAETSLRRPHYYQDHIHMNHHQWDANFNKVSETRVQASVEIPKTSTSFEFGYALVKDMVYYDTLSIARQYSDVLHVMSAALNQNFKIGPVHLDHKLLVQISSNQEVLPLPTLAANLRYYVQFPVVKRVLDMQIGANALFYTAYNIQAYSPDLGVFYNQNRYKWGNTPFIDLFVNMQWKRVSIFVKYTDIASGWPSKQYFSASNYARPSHVLKFGIHWPLYFR